MNIIFEYKNHFMSILAHHHEKHNIKPVDNKHKLSNLNKEQKGGFFKHLKDSWATVKLNRSQQPK